MKHRITIDPDNPNEAIEMYQRARSLLRDEGYDPDETVECHYERVSWEAGLRADQRGRPVSGRKFGYVRWTQVDTGEVKELAMAGVEQFMLDGGTVDSDWRQTSLELALALVPDLEVAIDRARLRGNCVEVRIDDGEEAEHV